MTPDTPLFDLASITTPDFTPEQTLAEKFDAFHAANPHVADALELLAAQWFAAGHQRVGTKALYERLRWEVGIQTSETEPSLNNNWTAFYGRLLLARRPEWQGRILTRRQKTEAAA